MTRMIGAIAVASAALLAACVVQPIVQPSGADLFAGNCASCHGPLGEGDGPVAAVLAVAVPNLRTLQQRNGGAFPTEEATAYIDGRRLPASHGDRLMPIWGDVFDSAARTQPGVSTAEMRIQEIVEFLRDLQY